MIWSQRPMAAGFVAHLRRSPDLGVADLTALSGAATEIRNFEAHATIFAEGDRGDRVHVVLEGWAARVKILESGSRQIPALFLSGDVCGLDALYLGRSDCAAVALTRVTALVFSRDEVRTLLDRHRGLRDAFTRMLAVELAAVTQWAVCLGRASARERMAHLLCELFTRMDAAGGATAKGCAMPLTQEEMADVLGLTAVHVNRTLQGMRAEGLITLRDQRLTIEDWALLARAAGFDAGYLHLGHGPETRAVGRSADHRGEVGIGV